MHMYTDHYLRPIVWLLFEGSVESTVNWSRLCMALQGGSWGTTGHRNDILKIVCRSLLVSRVTERHLVPCFIVCTQSLNHLGIWSAGLGCTREQLFSVCGECRTASVLVTPTCTCISKCISRQLSCAHIQIDFTVSQWCLQIHSEYPSM